MTTRGGRSSAAQTLGWALALVAGAALLIGGVEIALFARYGVGPLWLLDLFAVGGLAYIAAGVAACWRRPSNRIGVIMLAGGLGWFAVALANTSVPVLAAAGVVLATVPLAVVVYLLHAFPSGRLRSPASRWTVAAGFFVALVLEIPLYLFAPQASPGGMLAVADSPELVTWATWLQRGAGGTVMLVTAVILAARLRRATGPQRRVLVPLYAYGIVAVLFTPLAPDLIAPLAGLGLAAQVGLQLGLLAGAPVAFAAGMLRGGFGRMSEIQELGGWLGASSLTRPPLVRVLSRVLGDESLQLAFWVPDRDLHVDSDGRSLDLPAADSDRAAVEIELAGRRIGAVIYDAMLISDAELVRAAGRVVAIEVDRQRLTADLLASQEELRLSRIRLVDAADSERRRIAQNLHDGVQTTLVLLAIEAQQLAGHPGAAPAVAEAATGLRSRIDAAASELRELVHAVMPASLIERGLGAAAEDLADRMPVPTRLDLVVDGVLPVPVSSAAYFVVAESLANAVKHAQATSLAVRLARHGDTLVVEVSDDGVGGAVAGEGLGLRSLADRVDVLGGRLSVHSPAGQGTRLIAELPCG
jgi:signal transduction histidine kinase